VFFLVTSLAIWFNDGNAIENHAFKVVLYAVGFLFFSWFWRNGGQTLGMQAWRIKLVNKNEGQLSYLQCLKRYLCATILFGITLIWAFFNKNGEGFHDTVSNTKIIFKNNKLK